MAIAASPRGVAGVALPARSPDTAFERLCDKMLAPPSSLRQASPSAFGTLPDRLDAYMRGERVDFPDEIDRRGWTDFRSRVWDATRLIPYGQTRSYGWVAATAGQPAACRAAGQALHNNPVPILVPCHRVIGAGGALTGFGSGLELKRILLALESGDPAGSDYL
ncbi:MAG: MGMT family protein [Dehalococcoidia bacterium]|nr:MGMT family protein [Dehalococcoidia bacterium]